MNKNRIEYFDIAKGIAIICIILGHLSLPSVNRIVYTFHVPIFFIITGYFVNEKHNVSEFMKIKARTLLVPYYVVCLIVISFGVINGFVNGNAITELQDWIYASLYGSGNNYNEPYYIKSIGAVWFLWATFFGSLFFRIALKFNKAIRIISIIALFAFGYYSKKEFWYFPLSIQSGACATLFMYVGFLFHKSRDALRKIPKECMFFSLIFAVGIWVDFIKHFSSFWVVCCNFGRGMSDLFASICACFVVLAIAYFIDNKTNNINKILAYIGKYSLLVLCIHKLEVTLFQMVTGTTKLDHYAIIIPTKLIINLLGAWILSQIPFVRKLMGIECN